MADQSDKKGGWTPERSAAGDRSIWLVACIISIATFMEVLDTAIASVSLNNIAGSVSASYDEATWIQTSYLMANAISIPISGWLSNVIGRKRFYMLSVALFTASSFLCGIAPNLSFLIFARVLQGLGGGGLAPSEQSILTETFPPEKRSGAFALYGLVVIAAPVLGPTLGGIITDSVGWHWIFLLNIPIGIISLLLVSKFVIDPPKLEEERKARLKGGLRVDYLGIILLVLWLGCQEFVFDRGQREDWLQSALIKGMVVTAVVSCAGLVIWEWNRKEPVFDVKLLANRTYGIAIIAMMLTGVVYLGSTQVIPQFLQQALGYTATNAGEAMTLGGVATILALPIAGVLSQKIQPKYLLIAGLASEAAALLAFSRLNGEVSWWWAAIARTYLAFGLPLLFLPINLAAYADIPASSVPEASAQLNLARNLGGSIAISVSQALIEQRSQFHQSRLVETLTPADPNYQRWLQDIGHATGSAQNSQPVLAQLYQGVTSQAQVMAYMDVFWVFGIAMAVATPLLLLMKKADLSAPPA